MPSDEAQEKSKAMAYYYVSRAAFFDATKYHGIFTLLKSVLLDTMHIIL